MKLVDLNILIYAIDSRSPHHARALKYWAELLNSGDAVGLCWVVILGFIRVTTNPRIFNPPLTAQQAVSEVDAWLNLPNVRLVTESAQHWSLVSQLLRDMGTAGNRTTDVHLAAIAIGTGATLVSSDTDFARFNRLQWKNPLAID